MMLASAGKVARLVPLLGSPNDGEALGAARAIGRVLKAAGEDWHRLAAELLQPAPAVIHDHNRRPRRERTPRTAPVDPEVLRLVRAALHLEILNRWETEFAASILDAAQRSTWRPSLRQREILAKLSQRAQEAENCP